ncbi:MAG: MlaE family lipid ABC transporter permease subunit [Desulfovibrio sp.]|jgi:phospholipid/cholesterol/gamma-HCH transport system permease protein|nr:MlaE family lipid ABC transporter permease subunit [Desulfovibrio sp.]
MADDPILNFCLKKKSAGDSLVFSGELTAQRLDRLEKELPGILRNSSGPLVFSLEGLTRLDTAGALFLNRTANKLRAEGRTCSWQGLDANFSRLLELAEPQWDETEKDKPSPSSFAAVERLGEAVCEAGATLVSLLSFFGVFLCRAAGVVCNPRRLRATSLVFHVEQSGVGAVPIVALLTFLIGLVVAYMGARQLQMFGAQIFAVNLLEVTVLREMAVLITSIVVAGRSGSAFTAQIGAMQANEEIAALISMGLDPHDLLVLPRVLALILSLPLLVFLADIMALAGGAVAVWYTLDIDINTFISQLYSVAKMKNFLAGMLKTPFFALAIGLIGCFNGFKVSGSAESVGFMTTRAVVQSIFSVILLNAVFAIFFTAIRM